MGADLIDACNCECNWIPPNSDVDSLAITKSEQLKRKWVMYCTCIHDRVHSFLLGLSIGVHSEYSAGESILLKLAAI